MPSRKKKQNPKQAEESVNQPSRFKDFMDSDSEHEPEINEITVELPFKIK